LNALSPEMYTSFSAAGLQGANAFASATTQHQIGFRQGRALGLTSLTDENTETEGKWTLWSRALGNWSERDSDAGAMGYNQELGGLVAGTDRQFTEVLRAGIDTGYTDSDLEWDGTEHSGSMEGKHIGLYASVEPGNFFIDASGSYSDFTADANRIISFNGLSAEAESGFDADVWSGMLAGGYNFTISNWQLSPVASLSYARLSQDGFSEYGADFLNLDIAGTEMESLTSTLGFRFSGLIANGKWQFMPSLDLRWLHQFEDEGATVTANFANYESATFDVTGISPESDQGILSLGLTSDYGKNISVYVDYGLALADGYISQLVSGGLSWKF
jgi:outer membrane autotransporter protein